MRLQEYHGSLSVVVDDVDVVIVDVGVKSVVLKEERKGFTDTVAGSDREGILFFASGTLIYSKIKIKIKI